MNVKFTVPKLDAIEAMLTPETYDKCMKDALKAAASQVYGAFGMDFDSALPSDFGGVCNGSATTQITTEDVLAACDLCRRTFDSKQSLGVVDVALGPVRFASEVTMHWDEWEAALNYLSAVTKIRKRPPSAALSLHNPRTERVDEQGH